MADHNNGPSSCVGAAAVGDTGSGRPSPLRSLSLTTKVYGGGVVSFESVLIPCDRGHGCGARLGVGGGAGTEVPTSPPHPPNKRPPWAKCGSPFATPWGWALNRAANGWKGGWRRGNRDPDQTR